MEEVLKQILNKLDTMDNRLSVIEKENKEFRQEVNDRFNHIDKRLNRVEFEFIDTRVTLNKDIIPVINTIAENQNLMHNYTVNLVTTTEGIKQEVTAIGERVRRHEDKLESLA